MFRVLVLCVILTFLKPYTNQCRIHPPFHGDQCPGVGSVPNLDIMSEPIAMELIQKEEELAQFCQVNSPERIGQMYKTDNYYLIYDLIEAKNNLISVRIKHRYLHVTVNERYGNLEIIFQDMKVLPDILNTIAAEWTYKDEQILIIRIPYIVPLGTLSKSCPVVNKFGIYVTYKPPSEFNYSLQDWTQNGYNVPPGPLSGSNFGSPGWTQNGYNAPFGTPSGSNFGSQGWSQNLYNAPPGRPSGPPYGSQGWSQNVYNSPPGRPSGPNYGSQNSTQDRHNVTADPSSGFKYRSLDSRGNIP